MASDEHLARNRKQRLEFVRLNAKWVREQHFAGENDAVRCNSSTEVYWLVDRLLRALPQD